MPDPTPELRVSTRDDDALRVDLQRWLDARPANGPPHVITAVERPSANGMSSDTILLDTDGGRFVVRLAPAADAYPIFQTYDLGLQAAVMGLVAERTAAPVPRVVWDEPDPGPLGAPFFVMERVDGLVPPDVMPYPFGSWVTDATDAQRATMEDGVIGVLAEVHSIGAGQHTAFLEHDVPGATALRRHVEHQRRYYAWARDGLDFPVVERGFAWLDDHWPAAAEAAPAAVSWGDARIGNMLWHDFRPVAVLDWEMAGVAPREVDLGWCIYLHRFFQDLAEDFRLAGLPDFLERGRVTAAYREATGHTPKDLDWFLVYAALRHAIVIARATRRQVHFGDKAMPDDPEDLIIHAPYLRRLLDGTYW